jgi:nitroreductase
MPTFGSLMGYIPSLFLFVLTLVIVVGFIQGRSMSLLPPRIGGRPLKARDAAPGREVGTGLMSIIASRKSVRAFKNKTVEAEKVELLMRAARLAPSASNRQEWRFVIVDERQRIDRIAAASCIGTFVKDPGLIIAACAETNLHKMQCGELSYPIDVAIALDHVSLMAVELGLGTCWIGMFDPAKVKAILGIPENIKLVSLMVVGYPADEGPEEKKRLPIERISKRNVW